MPDSRTSEVVALINGEFVDAESPVFNIEDRGFAYADGAFETLRCIRGRLPLVSFHFSRLALACKTLRLGLDELLLQRYVQSVLEKACASHNGNGVLKIVVSRASRGRGCYLPSSDNVNVTLFYRAQGLVLPEPKTLVLSRYPLPFSSGLAGLKHMSRLEYISGELSLERSLALHEELLFLDANKCVVETMHHNLWVWTGQKYLTPALERVGVKGVAREALITALAKANVDVVETTISTQDLLEAEEVMLTNAVQGVVSVNAFLTREYPRVNSCAFLRNTLKEQYQFYEG